MTGARPTRGRGARGKAARLSGRRAEVACALLLMLKGYRILGFRLETRLCEIDLLAQRGDVPEEMYTLPLGVGLVKREGTDVTVVAVGNTMPEALASSSVISSSQLRVSPSLAGG